MLKTYEGSCHCGAVAYEVDLDMSAGSGKCNCSICAKKRNWGAIVKPGAFRLLAGEADLSDYQFGGKVCHHLFCKHCGVASFGRGNVPEIGGEYVSINLACLDGVEPAELLAAPIRFMDGLNNKWFEAPGETRHL